MRKIPRTMSTQHPDSVNVPSWCEGEVIQEEDEIHEAYFAYKELGCHEVMWDSEGKDVDIHVVRKLLAKYGDFFKEHVIGRDVFLTYRIPNPKVEVVERKVVAETLENIPVMYDVATAFYGKEVTPVFEVILPFTTHGKELICVLNYYKKAVIGVHDVKLYESITVEEWIGPLKPISIELIPLIEDMESLLKIDEIIEPYVNSVRPKYVRVFMARSDPALNYGLACAVILIKIALSKLKALEERTRVAMYPIVGVGTMPFRGHLSPENLQDFLKEYRGIYTVTIQSALKYDYPLKEVKEVVRTLNEKLPYEEAESIEAEEERILLTAMEKLKAKYQKIVEGLGPLINSVASYVPPRRTRRLHIGLFGYSRRVGDVILPRAIPFAGAFYSLGIPPEFIGFRALNDLSEEEWEAVRKYYVNMERDLDVAAGYLSWGNVDVLKEMCELVSKRSEMSGDRLRSIVEELSLDFKTVEERLGITIGPKSSAQRRYEDIVKDFLASYARRRDEEAKEYLNEAARIRRCLG